MRIKIKDKENVDLSQLLSDIDTDSIIEPFNEYLSSLESFFTEYTPTSSPSLIRWFQDFSPNTLNEEQGKFVTNALLMSNYDESALRGEDIILFSEPVIVSDLHCQNAPRNENESSVRLISFAGMEKKFTTKKINRVNHINKRVTTFKIYDVAWGLILPKHSDFKSIKVAHSRSLNIDYKNLERTQKALQNAYHAPLIEIQNIEEKFNEINSIISNKRDTLDIIQGDINALEQEKSHVESSLESSKVTLKKARNDLNKASVDFNSLVSAVADENTKLEAIRAKIEEETILFNSEEDKRKTLQNEVSENNKSLAKIKADLANARREKNLTNFDTLGHSVETGRQLKAYYCFAAATFIGLVCMAIYIYQNGQSFSESLPDLVDVSAWSIFLSRLPLVSATTLIVGGLSGVFFYLIKHIISLNTEKMTMLKAAILAEQITNSLDCKDMDELQRLDFQRNTKIKLIMTVFTKSEPDTNQNNIIIEALKALNPK